MVEVDRGKEEKKRIGRERNLGVRKVRRTNNYSIYSTDTQYKLSYEIQYCTVDLMRSFITNDPKPSSSIQLRLDYSVVPFQTTPRKRYWYRVH